MRCPPSTTVFLDNIVAVLRRSPAMVEHQDRHHARRADGTPHRCFAGSELGERHRAVRVSRTRRRRSNGAWIGRIGKTYNYFLYVASTLPLRSTRVRRQHSPLSLLCITMILRVRRKFFEITTFPNRVLFIHPHWNCSSKPPQQCSLFIQRQHRSASVSSSSEGLARSGSVNNHRSIARV